MAETTVEISVKGKWLSVPTVNVNGNFLIVDGKLIKKAVVHEEKWLSSDIEDPEACLRTLKAQKAPGLRADIFTFAQKLPVTVPKYNYPMEWESTAVVRLTSFKQWWKNCRRKRARM